MSRIRLARELADATGRNLHETTRFIRQVGPDTARRALRSADTRTSWRLPTLAGIGTGGVLVWRQQNVREAEAIADNSRNTMEALGEILGSDDLTAEQKAYLAEQIAQGSGVETDDDSSRFGLDLDGLEGTLIKVLVVVMVLAFVMNYATAQLPQPNVGVQAGVA